MQVRASGFAARVRPHSSTFAFGWCGSGSLDVRWWLHKLRFVNLCSVCILQYKSSLYLSPGEEKRSCPVSKWASHMHEGEYVPGPESPAPIQGRAPWYANLAQGSDTVSTSSPTLIGLHVSAWMCGWYGDIVTLCPYVSNFFKLAWEAVCTECRTLQGVH